VTDISDERNTETLTSAEREVLAKVIGAGQEAAGLVEGFLIPRGSWFGGGELAKHPGYLLQQRRPHVRITEWNGNVTVSSDPAAPVPTLLGDDFLHWITLLGGELSLAVGQEPVLWGGGLPLQGHNELEPARPREPSSDDLTAVLGALRDTRWDFRTPAGIARSLRLPESTVRKALALLKDAVRRPLAEDGTGRELYAAADRKPSWRERYMKLRQRLATW
jgi:hypothetical protein